MWVEPILDEECLSKVDSRCDGDGVATAELDVVVWNSKLVKGTRAGYNNAPLLREARMEMWMRRFSRS